MTRLLFGSFLVCLLGPWTLPVAAQTVQLADGRVLMAEVEEGSASGEGMRVKRLDNGGTLDLRWDHLSPSSALAWKKRFDLVGDTQEEVTVPAFEVTYMVNGARLTRIGLVEDGSDHVIVRTKGVPVRVARTELVSKRPVNAPVAQVLTMDEYYQQRRAALNPAEESDRWMLLADEMMLVRDYEHAKEALSRAKELKNSKNPQQLDVMGTKLQRYLEAAKELKALEEIRVTRSRGQSTADFERGLKLIAQFEKDFPQTKLKAEFETEKRKFADTRQRYLTGQVAEQWRRAIVPIVEKAIQDPAMNLEAAKDYAQNKMTDDITARLVASMKLEATEIKELWANRKGHPVGKRTESFSYAVGSWVLGEEALLKGTSVGKELDKQNQNQQPTNPNNAASQKFKKQLEEAMKRRQQAVQGAGAKKEQDPEDWWRQAERTEKITWLRAFYAEFGGQLVVTYATVSPCISCYGDGNIPEISPEGQMVRSKCYLCQATKWLRSFRAY
jgi:hypothetical protein